MSDILKEILSEHDEARELLDQIANARTKHVDYMKELYATLYGHHRAEEAVAFPPVKELDEEGKKLIAELRKEHTESETLLLDLIKKSEGEDKADMDKEMFEKLDKDVRDHMEEEETDYFKKAKEAMTAKELKDALDPFEEEEEKEKEKAEEKVGI